MGFLTLSSINKSFGTNTVVRDFNISVDKGEFISFLGPSGCGKTTVLRMIAGFETPSSGKISVEGQDVTGLSAARRRIGMMFQAYALFPNMTVRENVAFGLKIAKMDKAAIDARVSEMLGLIALDHLGDRYPYQLSGGQQQRVALTRALMQDPKIILANEPIASLDPMNAQVVMDSLRQIHERDGRTVIANLHTLDTARRYCDRIIGMRKGRIVFDGSPPQLTTGVARDIYGAGADFSEAATSTAIDGAAAGDKAFADRMLAD